MTESVSLRESLAAHRPVLAPGVASALFARLVESAGFSAVYVSGAAVSNFILGAPDLGLTTLTETAVQAQRIAEVIRIPMIVDADTGYGGASNVARTVRLLEHVGAAAIQLEDQTYPKRCGHFSGKQVVETSEMVERVQAALASRRHRETLIIARTDAAQPSGIREAIDRAHTYAAAGADALFVEAPRSVDELALIGRELGHLPLVANMVEFGASPLLPVDELGRLGFSLVIFPGSITRAVTRTVLQLLEVLLRTGTTESYMRQMATFAEVNSLLGLETTMAWEQQIAAAARDVIQEAGADNE